MNSIIKSRRAIFMLMITVALLCMFVAVLIVYLIPREKSKVALFQSIKDNDYYTAYHIIKKYPSLVNENRYTPDLFAKLFDTVSQTPLLSACAYGSDRKEFIELFVENGADLNKCGNTVHTYPILRVLKQNDTEIARYLIDNGADLLVSDAYSENVPYAVANLNASIGDTNIQKECLEILKAAIEKGAFVVPQETAFYYYTNAGIMSVYGIAASSNQALIVEYLLESSINSIDEMVHKENKTALIVATENNAYDVVKLLIKLGANKTIVDANGKTAYDYAVTQGNEDIAGLLK